MNKDIFWNFCKKVGMPTSPDTLSYTEFAWDDNVLHGGLKPGINRIFDHNFIYDSWHELAHWLLASDTERTQSNWFHTKTRCFKKPTQTYGELMTNEELIEFKKIIDTDETHEGQFEFLLAGLDDVEVNTIRYIHPKTGVYNLKLDDSFDAMKAMKLMVKLARQDAEEFNRDNFHKD